MRLLAAGLMVTVVALLSGCGDKEATVRSADKSATPSTFASVFAAAQPGDTILLASGNYGTFVGSVKTGMVTVKEQTGASATMRLDFTPAANITVDGVDIPSADLSGSTTKNIVIKNSRFTGPAKIQASSWNNNNVLLDSNTHIGINVCSGCGEGRIYLPTAGTYPTGLTIRNSLFEYGNMDGILNGSNGTVIENNEFRNLTQGDASIAHTDPIQLYGSKNTIVRGNYIHDNQVASGVMAADGTNHETFENNVIVQPPGADTRTLNIGGDNGSIVRHNTLVGTLMYKKSSSAVASRGGVIKDNIITKGITRTSSDTSAPAEFSYNLVPSSVSWATGTGNIYGQPAFVGGTGKNAYQLSAVSLGKGNASDGLDRGAIFNSVTPTPTPTPTADADVLAQAVWNVPVGAKRGTPVTLDGTASKGNAPLTCSWSFEDSGTYVYQTIPGCKISFTFQYTGTKYVRLTVTDADGDTNSSKKSFVVG